MTEALELQPSVSDGDLARAAAGGDRQAFAEIYDRYADRLYDFSVGLLGDRDAAADCVQDAFCVAATDLGDLREPDKLRPWLYSITRHHAMRRLRHRYREEVSDELPDMVSHEASPETLAGQSELARLVADAAGGLSDRDRELLDLSYRHGLDGPELAEALGVTLTSANTMMFRLRQTVERCLGALLVARGAQANPQACAELAAVLKGWDGQFTVLMRKRMARHIESCDTCEADQRRHVNPVALLGGSAVFIPAPGWLRRQTLDRVQLTSASSALTEASGYTTDVPPTMGASRQIGKRIAIVGIPALCLIVAIALFARPEDPVSKVVDVGNDSIERVFPVVPRAGSGPPAQGRSQPVPTARSAAPSMASQQAIPTKQAANTPGATPGPIPVVITPDPGPNAVPSGPQIATAPPPDSDANGTTADTQIAIATPPNPDPNGTTTDTKVDIAPLPNPKDTTTTGGGTTGSGSTSTGGGSTSSSSGSTTGGNTTTGGKTTGGTTTGGTTTGGTTIGGTTIGGKTTGGTTTGGTTIGGTTIGGKTTGGTTTGGTTTGGKTSGSGTNTNSSTSTTK